jgi:DNA-binding NarL/FixJ family response regulator
MVLTSKQREKLVLDLYKEGKTIREIAKEAKMSFRDIGYNVPNLQDKT